MFIKVATNGHGLHCSYASSNKNQIMCLHNCCKPMLPAPFRAWFQKQKIGGLWNTK